MDVPEFMQELFNNFEEGLKQKHEHKFNEEGLCETCGKTVFEIMREEGKMR